MYSSISTGVMTNLYGIEFYTGFLTERDSKQGLKQPPMMHGTRLLVTCPDCRC